MDNNTTTEIPQSQEDIVFNEMNFGLDQIKIRRQELLDQLVKTTSTTRLDFEGDAPRKTEMKLSLFKTVDDLLKSQESLLTSKAKMLLAKKSESSNEALKGIAVEILRNIEMNKKSNTAAPVSVSDQDAALLKQAFTAMENEDPSVAIKDDELVMDESEVVPPKEEKENK